MTAERSREAAPPQDERPRTPPLPPTDQPSEWSWSPEVLDLIGPHCDISDRLKQVPPSARVRGVWFRILDKALSERGHTNAYDALFPRSNFRALPMYPVSEFLVRAAVTGALIAGPERLHEGMYEMAHQNSQEFGRSLFGRTLIRLLARDPKRLTHQAVASSRQTTNYGRWSPTFPDDHTVEMHHQGEYVWIESYMVGAGVGTYEALGYDVTAEVELRGPFDGVARYHLSPR